MGFQGQHNQFTVSPNSKGYGFSRSTHPINCHLTLKDMGFQGQEQYLTEADDLKDTMRKQSRADPRARQPREWLGRDGSSGFRRLLPASGIPLEGHRVTGRSQPGAGIMEARQFSQSNRHSTIGTGQTQYHEALPLSANVQSHLTSSFADNGTAS